MASMCNALPFYASITTSLIQAVVVMTVRSQGAPFPPFWTDRCNVATNYTFTVGHLGRPRRKYPPRVPKLGSSTAGHTGISRPHTGRMKRFRAGHSGGEKVRGSRSVIFQQRCRLRASRLRRRRDARPHADSRRSTRGRLEPAATSFLPLPRLLAPRLATTACRSLLMVVRETGVPPSQPRLDAVRHGGCLWLPAGTAGTPPSWKHTPAPREGVGEHQSP